MTKNCTQIQEYMDLMKKLPTKKKKQCCVGEQALYESGFSDGEPVSCYTCLGCVEEWLEESGQAVNEDE